MTDICNNYNKEILWSVMYENGLFNDIPDTGLNDIKNIFEETIQSIASSIPYDVSKKNATELNKIILQNMTNNIDNYKKNMQKNMQKKMFEERKEKINKVLAPEKPKEIEFFDKSDDDKPITGEDMNVLLDKMYKERNIDLPDNLPHVNSSQDNSRQVNSNQDNSSQDNSVPKIKISNLGDLINESLEIIDIHETSNKSSKSSKSSNLSKLNPSYISKVKSENVMIKQELSEINSSEYKHEKRVNESYKLNNIYNLLQEIEKNQKLILKKLDCLSINQ